jgi:hypothetical protein
LLSRLPQTSLLSDFVRHTFSRTYSCEVESYIRDYIVAIALSARVAMSKHHWVNKPCKVEAVVVCLYGTLLYGSKTQADLLRSLTLTATTVVVDGVARRFRIKSVFEGIFKRFEDNFKYLQEKAVAFLRVKQKQTTGICKLFFTAYHNEFTLISNIFQKLHHTNKFQTRYQFTKMTSPVIIDRLVAILGV